ncbi:AraC family transcriptional regulator [Hoeflea alexandrii]|uniref:AraC family transcriptional regulator n=1 Tax=Hoeflea alexandrii TaxID=288436 RepID=UPI0022AE87A7|nr:AraC family transcriptional regulator [Hoeflea alexandrii]MCZ4290029.1 AraC family transcriptional regulator [Hoeflea alexandrii]
MDRVNRVSRMQETGQAPGLERMAAFFRGHAFSPHRHDTYAVGITLAGVQCFSYRGARHRSGAGQAFVLHPDELHDGRQGDDRGFGYRIAYLDPMLIARAGGLTTLPFVRDPVGGTPELKRAIAALLTADDPASETCVNDGLVALADALARAAGLTFAGSVAVDGCAVGMIRELLMSRLDGRVRLAELEACSGLSRWQIARQFRAAYGVGPHRFHLLRRLDRVRALIVGGQDLAEAALATGFADQAHMSRQFRAVFGLSPGEWRGLTRAGGLTQD